MKIELRNFRGVSSADIDIDKVTVLGGAPGTGKTSVLAAIKAALDGNISAQDIGSWGTSASVTLTLDDGTVVERRRTASATKTLLNGRQTTAGSAAEYLEKKLGAPVAAIGAMMGQEIWKAMSDKDIAKTLFAVLPVDPATADALALATSTCGLTPAGADLVKTRFAPESGHIGDREAAAIYKAAYGARTDAGREMKRLQAVVGAVQAPSNTADAVHQWLVDVAADEAALKAYQSQAAAYEKAVQAASAAKTRKEELVRRAKAPGIPSVPVAEAAVKAAETAVKAAKAQQAESSVSVRRLSVEASDARSGVLIATREKEAAVKEGARLASGACLAMSGLTCPHVQALARDADERRKDAEERELDLGMAAAEAEEALEQARSAQEAAEKAVSAASDRYRDAVSVLAQARAAASAREAAAGILVPELPAKPEPPAFDANAVRQRREAAMAELAAITAWERRQEDEKALARLREEWEALDNVCDVFGPKGAFRDAILRRVLSPLEAKANEAAAAACPEMAMKFATGDAGFTVLLRPKAGAAFRPLANASTGEFTIAAYLLMRVMGSIKNPGILILDNLDALDSASFGRLVAAIASDAGVPHAVMATVDHDDTMKAIAGIPGVKTELL